MKKKHYALIGLLALLACNEAVKEESETKTEEPAAAQTGTTAVTDPVCGMEKAADWTEFSVTGTDTTWFCSPHCKETFAKKGAEQQHEEEHKEG